jgi:hypothetical protein
VTPARAADLTQYQRSRLKVVIDADGFYVIYYPMDELLDADGNVLQQLQDGYLEGRYVHETDAIVSIRRLKRR